jgi:hypothetical protein
MIKTAIGIVIIVATISTLYAVGRITMWCMQEKPTHFAVVLIAGVLGLSMLATIAFVGLMAYVVRDSIMQHLT